MTNDAAVEDRRCRRCNAEVAGERHESEDGVTLIWRCTCGWASARTESGEVSRARPRERGQDDE
jgi:hypothetical protein